MVTVLLAHESKLVRQALVKILSIQDGIAVIGHAETGPDAIKKIDELGPDVLVLDTGLPELNGMVPKERKEDAELSMVVTRADAPGQAETTKYIRHDDTLGELVGAVISTAGEDHLVEHIHSKSEALKNLTKRERQILKLVADGLSNRQISVDMEITERTVKYHISNILRKLDLFSRTEAAILFLKGDLQAN